MERSLPGRRILSASEVEFPRIGTVFAREPAVLNHPVVLPALRRPLRAVHRVVVNVAVCKFFSNSRRLTAIVVVGSAEATTLPAVDFRKSCGILTLAHHSPEIAAFIIVEAARLLLSSLTARACGRRTRRPWSSTRRARS